jgi:hypothetical protein
MIKYDSSEPFWKYMAHCHFIICVSKLKLAFAAESIHWTRTDREKTNQKLKFGATYNLAARESKGVVAFSMCGVNCMESNTLSTN